MSRQYEGVNPEQLAEGVIAMAAVLALGFAADLFAIKERSFGSLRQMAESTLGRVILVHIALIGGIGLAAWLNKPKAFFVVFIGLKLLSELSSSLPQWDPEKPPAWLNRLMERFGLPSGQFEEYWRVGRAAHLRHRQEDEQVG
jgi:hypothetical protein